MQICFWRNLSQRECVGASVTSAEVKRALFQRSVHTKLSQRDKERRTETDKERKREREKNRLRNRVCGVSVSVSVAVSVCVRRCVLCQVGLVFLFVLLMFACGWESFVS